MGIVFGIILFVILLLFCIRCICIVPQGNEWVIELLGQYHGTWEAGLHLKIPVVMRVAKKVSIKQQSADFEPQLMKTSDGVNILVDWVVFFTVRESKLFTYGVERPIAGIENLSNTTLLSIVGAKPFDEIFKDRAAINAEIGQELDVATDPWGIKVDRVEIKNIRAANESVNQAMEQEMIAEREKRAMILRAEGEKQSQETLAEANKNVMVLQAEGEAESAVKSAEGQAQAILKVQRARAEAIGYINQANPSQQYLQLESMKTAASMAEGQATTVFIPTDLVGVANGIAGAVGIGKPIMGAMQPKGQMPTQPQPQK